MKTIRRNLFGGAALLAVAFSHDHCGMSRALRAQTAAPPIAGTVTDFRADALEIGVQPDRGAAVFFKVGPDTEVVQVPPGEHDLSKAKPLRVIDIARGDRILASFVTGLTEARRIVLISATDISARNEAERLDWKTRGVSGIVASTNGDEIRLEVRTADGARTVTVTVTGKTRVRRYAPDSVRFADAVPSRTAEMAPGDQCQARGRKSDDQTRITADDVVFGTFLSRLGPITAVNREANQIQIQELTTKKPLTIRLAAGSQIKMMTMVAGTPPSGGGDHAEHGAPQAVASRFDLQQMLERLPQGKIDDLKVGGGVVVTSTKGAKPDEITAIMLIANADFLIQMAQGSGGEHDGGMEAISRLHGGMLAGPTGLSLPTMIQ